MNITKNIDRERDLVFRVCSCDKDDVSLFLSIQDMIVISSIARQEKMRKLHYFFKCRILIDKGHNSLSTAFSWNTKRKNHNTTCSLIKISTHFSCASIIDIRSCSGSFDDRFSVFFNWKSSRWLRRFRVESKPSVGYLTILDFFTSKNAL